MNGDLDGAMPLGTWADGIAAKIFVPWRKWGDAMIAGSHVCSDSSVLLEIMAILTEGKIRAGGRRAIAMGHNRLCCLGQCTHRSQRPSLKNCNRGVIIGWSGAKVRGGGGSPAPSDFDGDEMSRWKAINLGYGWAEASLFN